MAKRFEEIEVGDQLEMTAGHGCRIYGADKEFNPDMVVQVSIVTHIWFDPVDNKEYVALASLKRDGSYGKPTEKRTLTGLARTGWKKARKDYIAEMEAILAADKKRVVQFRRSKKK